MSSDTDATPESGSFTGIAEIFDKPNMPWWFVRVPTELSKPLEIFAERGLIAVTATVGKASWQTSLMPYGDGTHFIALPAKVRKPNSIRLGDSVTVAFVPRDRKSGEDARMSK
jgi:hypothetical protein